MITLGLHLAAILQIGFSSQLSQNENKIMNEISQNIPLEECDMIIVSSEPYEGERNTGIVYKPGCVNAAPKIRQKW